LRCMCEPHGMTQQRHDEEDDAVMRDYIEYEWRDEDGAQRDIMRDWCKGMTPRKDRSSRHPQGAVYTMGEEPSSRSCDHH